MVSVCAPVFAGGGGDLAGEVQAWTDTTKTTEIMYMEYREEPHAPVWNEKKFEGYTWKIYTWGGLLSDGSYISEYIPAKDDFTVLGPDGNPVDFDIKVEANDKFDEKDQRPAGYRVFCTTKSAATGMYTVTMTRTGYKFLYRGYRDSWASYQEEGIKLEVYPRPIITIGEEDSQGNVKVTIDVLDDYKSDEIEKIWCTVTSEWIDDGTWQYYNSKEVASSTTFPIECILSKSDCYYEEDGYTSIRATVRYRNSNYSNWSHTRKYRFPSDGPAPELPNDPDEPEIPEQPTTPTQPSYSGSSSSGGSSSSSTVEKPKSYTVAQALKDVKKAEDGKVQLKNVAEIPYTTLKALKGKDVVIQADQKEKGKIVFRMTIDPAQASKDVKSIQVGAKLEDKKAQEKFEKYFSNEMRFIKLNQKGSFACHV